MINSLFSLRALVLAAGVALALPATGEARDIKFRRDLDGDGHFNTKKIDIDRHRHHGGHYRGHYGGYRGYGGYYGSGYRSYGYGYGYGSPYYRSYPYYSYGPSVGVTYYSRPSTRTYVYRDNADDTGADVQRALKRRGYYHGPIDGIIGSGTRSAIRNFQADKRLDVNGRIDRDTLRELDLD